MRERMEIKERPEGGRRKQALGLIRKQEEINGPGEDAVSSGKGMGSFLDVVGLSLLGLGLRNWEAIGLSCFFGILKSKPISRIDDD